MRKRIFVNVILCFLLGLVQISNVYSWDNETTHRDLSKYAADNSVLGKNKGNYLKNLGINLGLDEVFLWEGKNWTAVKWLQEGAFQEDAGSKWDALTGKARFNNHFHNPLKPWAEAGLDDWVGLHYTGESSLLWAQDGNKQQSIAQYGGDWSWQKTRDYFYDALISTSETSRQEIFAKTFRGLGHQIHLLQDTAVPDHVRNDAHPEDALFGKNLNGNPYFESWAKNQRQRIIDLASNPVFPNVSFNVSNGLAPVTQLFDTDAYDGLNASAGINQGLSEYTNANFFSNDTLFAAEIYSANDRHYFPYPKKASTDIQSYIDQIKSLTFETAEDGIEDKGIWIKKERDGESIINHFVRAGRWTSRIYDQSGASATFYKSFYRDDKCHEDYATLLIPRAVGYSAGLLDYFFRGTIDIAVPSNGVYSMIDATKPDFDPETTDFTSIKLRAKNTTVNNEEMTNGTIQLVVKYKVAHADPFQPGPVETDTEFSYTVVPEKNGVSSLSRSAYTELNFDLSEHPISLWATDVYLQVVYKGTLGNEENAVAIGFKDISEPTPLDIFSNTDQICIGGSWYVAGSQQAIEQVDANHNDIADYPGEADVYGHNPQDIYILFSPYSETTYRIASPTYYDIKFSNLAPANHKRVMYLLSDYQFDDTSHVHWVKRDAPDNWPISDVKYLHFDYAVKRQVDYSEDSGLCGGNPPCYLDYYPGESTSFPAWQTRDFYTFRGARMWWGTPQIYTNLPPTGSQCSFDLLQ